LIDEHGSILLTVPYTDTFPWPVATAGTGHSLILANPSYGEGDPRAWAISDMVGGSPGQMESFPSQPVAQCRHQRSAGALGESRRAQFVELYNHSTNGDLSGCILTDNTATNQFVIPRARPSVRRDLFPLTPRGLHPESGRRHHLFHQARRQPRAGCVQFEGQAERRLLMAAGRTAPMTFTRCNR
jgi:hypothetical protein